MFKLVVHIFTTRPERCQFSPAPCYFRLWGQHFSKTFAIRCSNFADSKLVLWRHVDSYARTYVSEEHLYSDFGHESKPRCHKMLIRQQSTRHGHLFLVPSAESKVYRTVCVVLTKRVPRSLAANIVSLSDWQMVLFARGLDMHTLSSRRHLLLNFQWILSTGVSWVLNRRIVMFQSNKCTVLGTEKYASVWYIWLCVFTNNEAYKQTNSVIHYPCLFSQQDSNSSLLQLIPSLVSNDKWITWSSH
jgi:hypothetical protein